MKHSYTVGCACARCDREGQRRTKQSDTTTTFSVMAERVNSGNARQRRQAAAFWDVYESGRPLSSDDY